MSFKASPAGSRRAGAAPPQADVPSGRATRQIRAGHNLKTAKALGLAVPSSIQLLANLISGHASTGYSGHRVSDALEKPFLHLFYFSRRPRRENDRGAYIAFLLVVSGRWAVTEGVSGMTWRTPRKESAAPCINKPCRLRPAHIRTKWSVDRLGRSLKDLVGPI